MMDTQEVKKILEGSEIAAVRSQDIPIKDKKIIATALEWIDAHPQGTAKTVIGDIEITRRGIHDDFSHVAFPDKLAVLPAIKTVLEKGAYLGFGADLDGKNINNYYFAAPVKIDDNRKIVFVRARKRAAGANRFYVHDVYTEEDIKKSGGNKTTATRKPKGTPPDLYLSILNKAISVKPFPQKN
jgi:hypothetical protein